MMQFSKRIGVALTAVAFCKCFHSHLCSISPLTTSRWTTMLGTRSRHAHRPVDEHNVPDLDR